MKKLLVFLSLLICSLGLKAAPQTLLDENGNEYYYYGTYDVYEGFNSGTIASTPSMKMVIYYRPLNGNTTILKAIPQNRVPYSTQRVYFYNVSNSGAGKFSHSVVFQSQTFYFNL